MSVSIPPWSKARAAAWVFLRISPKTLKGLQAKVDFADYLSENVDDLETWPHTDDWPNDRLGEDVTCLTEKTKKRLDA